MLATCRELGVALVPYAPLGRGLLTNAFSNSEPVTAKNDLRGVYFPHFQEANRDTNVKLVGQLKSFADKKCCTTSQLAISWLLKQGDNIIPIPGTKKIKYLEENWGSLDVHLTDDEEKEIRKFVETAEIAGARVPLKYMKGILVETKEES
jgi:aryl-alcohol dehydrogenase-like predicted oxidoreductase